MSTSTDIDYENYKAFYVGSSKKKLSHNEPDYGSDDTGFTLKSPTTATLNAVDEPLEEMPYDNEEIYTDEPLAQPEVSEIVNDEHESEPIRGNIEGKGIYYKTKDVARELGIKEQDVRNLDKQFAEFLNVERTPSGHRLFTREYIDKLASILELKRNNNYTNEQTKEALSTNEGQILAERNELERLHKLLELVTSKVESSNREIKQAIHEEVVNVLSSHTDRLLLETSEKNDEQIELLKQQNDERIELLKKQNEELKEALIANQKASSQSITELKEQLNVSKEQNARMLDMMTSILADQNKKDEKITKLSEQNEQVLAEVTKKKKHWFSFS